MSDLPCNCGHSKTDHKPFGIGMEHGQEYETGGWCVYSEYGQCPCDWYTEMGNFEYVEFVNDRKEKHG